MVYRVELEREDDGRWLADVVDLPGVMAYGATPEEARANVAVLVLRVLADKIAHHEVELPDGAAFSVTLQAA